MRGSKRHHCVFPWSRAWRGWTTADRDGEAGRQERCLADSSALTPEVLRSLVRCLPVFSIIFLPFFRAFVPP